MRRAGWLDEALHVATESRDRWAEGVAHAITAGLFAAHARSATMSLAGTMRKALRSFVSWGTPCSSQLRWAIWAVQSKPPGQGELLSRARDQIQESLAMARAIGMSRDVAVGLLNLGRCSSIQGDIDSAVAHLKEGLELSQEIGARVSLPAHCKTFLADAGVGRGDVDGAQMWLEEALNLAQGTGSPVEVACLASSRRGSLCVPAG